MDVSVLKVAAFLRRNYPACQSWPKPNFLAWLNWLCQLNAIACVLDNGRLIGVGIARPVLTMARGKDHYAVDNGGTILWVDVAAAKTTHATALLLKIARNRWGERVFIAFHRRKWGHHTVLPWGYFMGRFNRKEICYGR